MDKSVATRLLRAILKWWWLIAVAVSLGVGVGYLARTEQQDLYFARASVIVGGSNSPVPVGISQQELDGYQVLLRRNSLLQTVIDDLGLDISVADFQKRLTIETTNNSAVIGIGVVDTDPERAAVIANRIAQELITQTTSRASLLNLDFVNQQIADVQNQISQLQSHYDDLVNQAKTLVSAFDLNQNLDERTQTQKTIDDLRGVLLNLVNNAPKSNVQMFESATPNYFPFTSNGVRDLVIAGLAGGILAILTIVLFTFFDDRLQWDEGGSDMIAGVRVLGPLGIIRHNRLPLYVDAAPQAIETEALRQVRAKIALAAGGTYPQVLAMTSYDSGEGKTLTTANMALELARSRIRTLVIDGDMRRGDIHEIFRVPNIFGFSDVLASHESMDTVLSQALLTSGYDNLTLITAGRSEADPAALLSRPRFGQLIESLRFHFDAILLDAAPILGGPDAVFLTEASDGVIIIVSARRTRLSSLNRTLDELNQVPNANILGVVYNRVRLQVTSKYNNNYYRQTTGLSLDKLDVEVSKLPRGGLAALRANIILGPDGQRLYSMAGCAMRLGVKKQTVQEWIKTGYLRSERRFWRQWVRESFIETLMEQQRARAHTLATENPSQPPPSATNGTHHGSDQLREQREALLDFAKKPDTPDLGL